MEEEVISVDRVVREDIAEEVTFKHRPKKRDKKRVTKEREFWAGGPAGAKALRQEGTWAVPAQRRNQP